MLHLSPLSLLLTFALVTLWSPSSSLAQIINTPPSLVQCLPARITFSGGVAPWIISVLPGGQTAATPLAILPPQTTLGGVTWIVNQPAGTEITFSIRDGAGTINYSSILVVQAGVDDTCLTATGTSSAAPVTPTTTIPADSTISDLVPSTTSTEATSTTVVTESTDTSATTTTTSETTTSDSSSSSSSTLAPTSSSSSSQSSSSRTPVSTSSTPTPTPSPTINDSSAISYRVGSELFYLALAFTIASVLHLVLG